MLESIKNPKEIKDYISNLSSLTNLINENYNNGEISSLTDYVKLLKFKVDNNLIEKLSIESCSGMISFGDISLLIAEKNNVPLKSKFTFTSEKLRDKLIERIDSMSIENFKDFDLTQTTDSLAKRYYLSMLDSANIKEQITLTSNLIEEGESSNLIRINLSGYCPSLRTITSESIDLYFENKRFFNKHKAKISTTGKCSLPKSLENTFKGWLGVESNIIYHLLQKRDSLQPRKVTRTVIAPFYQIHFKPNDFTSRIDPNCSVIYENIFLSKNNNPYILSIHTDESTTFFDVFDESDSESSEKHLLNIEHKYITTDKKIRKKLEKYIPKKQIISPN